ncbi:MAG TPA: hypothetical protein VK495_13180 [Steroidobacteraceae bacterium]|nr:hypothetical protein [Steroidobacteraceae bacterium]
MTLSPETLAKIAANVAAAPPLTTEQRDRLALLLRPAAKTARRKAA